MQQLTAITALILAGGQGRRMQNQDKGLLDYQGLPLIAHVLNCIAPQVDRVLINCNRNHGIYARYGWPLVHDTVTDHGGPLRGIESAIKGTKDTQCLVIACDMPDLDHSLVRQLQGAIGQHQACCFVLNDRLQPLPVLFNPGVIDGVTAVLEAGERSIKGWLAGLDLVSINAESEVMFTNINQTEQMTPGAPHL